MALSDEDVREILRIIDESSLDELRIETDGFSLHVRKRPPPTGSAPADASAPASPEPPAAEPPAAEPPASAADGHLVTVPSPMLGTFYRAEGPGATPFVEVGARVGPETTLCIIEVMKMMNSVAAGVTGTIAEVCPENAQLVEYGEPLFRVRPDGTD
jgi:acetyl-CoA carboxylase biotin carboxyl carrier protein